MKSIEYRLNGKVVFNDQGSIKKTDVEKHVFFKYDHKELCEFVYKAIAIGKNKIVVKIQKV